MRREKKIHKRMVSKRKIPIEEKNKYKKSNANQVRRSVILAEKSGGTLFGQESWSICAIQGTACTRNGDLVMGGLTALNGKRRGPRELSACISLFI